MMSLKVCKTCKEKKPLADFHNHAGTRDRRQPSCKGCHSVRQKIRYQKNKSSVREYTRNYRDTNREQVRSNARRYYADNHKVLKAKKKQKYNENPEKFRARTRAIKLKFEYGLTIEQFNAMIIAQDNKCAICGGHSTTHKNLTIDHCHTTGKVRDLLCQNCNSGLGHFKDDPDKLIAAAKYLWRHS